jgi:molecular chaperone Hsp33
MNYQDKLLSFIFKSHAIRGAFIQMNQSYQAILDRHPYPEKIKNILGETLAISVLLGASIKYEGHLTLQVRTDGPLTLLVAQCNNHLQVRGLAQWQGEIANMAFSSLLGKGKLVMTVTPKDKQQYQSIIPLTKGNLANSVSSYFQQSEQLPTAIILKTDENVVKGILLQAMPNNNFESDTNELLAALYRIPGEDVLTLSHEKLLEKYFPNEEIEFLNSRPISFNCSCSVPRMERALLTYDTKEIQQILKTDKEITVTCEFCNYSYHFDAADYARILAEGPKLH